MTNRPARVQVEYKEPTFNGKGDVEYFVLCFTDVSPANDLC